ncbi:hypothetical protein [Nocardiopsis ansamitocini]|uniref:hypothetical protein n=1 Tax=Nocardiopsis ansamitocini TaxID=1670832 RepID=UPI0025529139|nr:hypothetical protein [Nocardiopsis ansamitocini]
MANAWMPGVERADGTITGGRLHGGAPRAVWHTTESDPKELSARAIARELGDDERAAHLVWNPVNGEIVQLLPATAAATRRPQGTATDWAQEGRVCVRVLVLGHSAFPFTNGPLIGLDRILEWLDSWGVPRHWPAGSPIPRPASLPRPRSVRLWAQGGHFGQSQVPGSKADGPGAIDIERMRGAAIPRPRPEQAPSTSPQPVWRSHNGTRPHATTSPS